MALAKGGAHLRVDRHRDDVVAVLLVACGEQRPLDGQALSHEVRAALSHCS